MSSMGGGLIALGCGEQRRSQHAGLRPTPGKSDLGRGTDTGQDKAERGPARRAEQHLAGGAGAASDRDDGRVEKVDRVGDADPEAFTEKRYPLPSAA